MPVEVTPLFRPEVIRPRVAEFRPSDHALEGRAALAGWADLLDTAAGMERKETELLPEYLTDVFQRVLGYSGPAQAVDGRYSLSREKLVEVGGKFADAVLGVFTAERDRFAVAVEGKGPKDPLDRPYAGRRMSAVDQAYRYAINLPCDWLVVTNLREIRLYHKGSTQRTYERFVLRDLVADEYEFARFVYLLGSERVAPAEGRSHLYGLLDASERAGDALTQEFYHKYSEVRRELVHSLVEANPSQSPKDSLGAAQRLLDRALFIAFAEDRSLLPPDTLANAYQHRDPYNPRPIWENFRGLFRAIDRGNDALGIPLYNGGLFRVHSLLDEQLVVPDAACELLKRLGDYNYGPPATAIHGEGLVDVEILGHIFEQSIEDLEEMRAAMDGGNASRTTSKRKREGAFYTPRFVTEYIVERALRPVLDERFEQLRRRHHQGATGTAAAVLVDPRVYDLEKINNPQRDALVAFWEAWIEEVKAVRILDPACGSGAFLIEVFDQLHAEYQQTVDRLAELRHGSLSLFDPDKAILQHNVYGVDLNDEAIEIARLSVWIKTAQRGKVLTDLDHNVRVGNSVVDDATVDSRAFDWSNAFPEVAAQGGFDVVVGNPPYVRGEMLGAFKPHFQGRYSAYHGSADLYVYFYELGVRLLRPGGRMSYIVTNKWLKTGYAEPLRAYLNASTWVEEIVDLGHAKQVFPDADVFPCILRVRKPTDDPAPERTRVSVIPRDDLETGDFRRQIEAASFNLNRQDLNADAWSLEPAEAADLLQKIQQAGVPLQEYVGQGTKYGIKTGYNEAFLIDTITRNRLVADDPRCSEIIRPYLRGRDIGRWTANWDGEWMIFMTRGVDLEMYPSIRDHLLTHRERLEPKPAGWQGDRWGGRAGGAYAWYELQASPGEPEIFSRPKIVYQEIQFHPAYALDLNGRLLNNKCFLIPSADLYLLGVLNSPVMWWYNWRTLPHMKDEALSPVGYLMDVLPIATPSEEVRSAVESAVGRLITITESMASGASGLTDWLRIEFDVAAPGQKLGEPHTLDFDTFVQEVKKRRAGKSRVTPSELGRLRQAFDDSVGPLRAQFTQACDLESEVAGLVIQAYGLTQDDVDLMWRTAPPRMPLAGRPTAAAS